MYNFKTFLKTIFHISVTFVLVVFLTGFFISCAKKVEREIIIGVHIPLSGPGALIGVDQKWAYEKAAADINKDGGIYVKEHNAKLPVRLIMVDDETDAGKAAAAVERLIKKDKVDMFLSGQVGAQGVLPGMITAEKYKTYYHGTVIWPDTFRGHNFKWATMYFFEPAQGAAMIYEVLNSSPKDQRPKKIGLFMEDSFDGKMMGDGLAIVGKMNKYNIPLRVSTGVGSKDFSTQVLKGKAAGIDTIIGMANVPEAVTLLRQMKENNFSVKHFLLFKGTWAQEFYTALKEDTENVLMDGFWFEGYPYKGAKELGKLYYDDFKKTSTGIGLYYAVCQILWQAIEKAGTLDGAKIRQAVLDNTFETVMGKVDYDEKGVALFKIGCAQWRDGKQVVLFPFEAAQDKIMAMKPWNER